VRDIPLIRAIIELVDNSVDGATHLQSNENYKDIWIKISFNKEYFKIEDNCGGITVNEAEEYAFKFGRDNDAEVTPKSIGRFGIGMKRAFFKMEKKIKVESTIAFIRKMRYDITDLNGVKNRDTQNVMQL
jgi:HSP90 family molecular chaperone